MGRSRSRDRDRDRRRERDRERRGDEKRGEEKRGDGEEKRGRSRDRDRGERKKRSRSDDSAERSREREKKRRRDQRDFMIRNGKGVPQEDPQKPANRRAKGEGQGHGAPRMDGGGKGNMFWDGFQWINMVERKKEQDAVTRKLRRLYVGNLPMHMGLTPDMFRSDLRELMAANQMCENPAAAEIQIWFAEDPNKHYGFIEMDSVELAEKVLIKGDGMLVQGQPISIKRPNDTQVQSQLMAGTTAGAAGAGGPLAIGNQAAPTCTSRIVQICDALLYDPDSPPEDDDEYDETLDDMEEGAKTLGDLKINKKNCKIIRPVHLTPEGGGLSEKDPALTVGTVFLEFTSLADASEVMAKLWQRKYDGRLLKYVSYAEDTFYDNIVPLA